MLQRLASQSVKLCSKSLSRAQIRSNICPIYRHNRYGPASNRVLTVRPFSVSQLQTTSKLLRTSQCDIINSYVYKRAFCSMQPYNIVWQETRSARLDSMENRERETEELMNTLVNNRKVATDFGQNDTRLTVVCASQMHGSGKTHFGRAFLSQASKPEFRKKWESNYPSQKDQMFVAQILDSLYVYVDFQATRTLGATLDDRISSAAYIILNQISNLVVAERPELKSEIEQYWTLKLKEGEPVFVEVIHYFTVLLNGRLIFLHFDDIDRIIYGTATVPITVTGVPEPQILEPFYVLWQQLLHPAVQHGLCYVSGRSPYLYFLGKDLLRNNLWVSSTARHMFFDRLLLHNIKNLIEQNYRTKFNNGGLPLTDGYVEAVARKINKWSGGIPRFVVVALDYFVSKDGDIAPLLTNEEMQFELLYNSLIESRDMFAELNQYLYLQTTADRELYLQYAGDALLSIPHKMEKHNLESFASLLVQLWRLGIYTAKSPQIDIDTDNDAAAKETHNCFHAIFPYAVAMHLRNNNVWPSVFENPPFNYDNVPNFKSTVDWLKFFLDKRLLHQEQFGKANSL